MERKDFVVTPELLARSSSHRLDAFLAEILSRSRSSQQVLIENGKVWLNGKIASKASQTVRVGDKIEVDVSAPPTKDSRLTPIPADLPILHEDQDILVINKPQGLVVHPAPSHQGPTLVHHLLHHLADEEEFEEPASDRPGIVHRLDKGTSGLILVAKNAQAHERLSDQFKDRKVKKMYEALVWGRLTGQGRFESSIGRDKVNRRKMSSRTSRGRKAVTDWKSNRLFAHFTHVLLFPFTGRTHQLRVHLAENGNPIVGDAVYGRGMTPARKEALPAKVAAALGKLDATLLHAATLSLEHPRTGKPLSFEAPRPEVFDTVLRLLEELDR